MKRVISLALILVLASILTFPAAAQPGWSLYLLNSSTQQIVRVYLDGTQQTYDLGVPGGAYLGTNEIDFTSDGGRAAYCLMGDGGQATLTVRDLAAQSTLASADLGSAQGCWVTYSDDNSQIAVGLMRHYPGDPGADPNLPTWQLLILDAATGNQLHELNPNDGAAAFDPSRAIMPEVRYFANNQIVFAGLPWGTEGFPSSPAYLWRLGDGIIQPIDRWWRWGLDSLNQTGELVWVELDPSLPAADPGGPVPQANVVKLADKSGQERTIYADPNWVLLDAKFIDNGRQLAINALQAASGNPGAQATRWLGLDRSGNVSELATTAGFSEVAAAPDGYVILWASDASASPLLALDYHSGRETTRLWQQQASGGITWSLLWAAPTATADGLGAFPAVSP